jgi:hypothetical protein
MAKTAAHSNSKPEGWIFMPRILAARAGLHTPAAGLRQNDAMNEPDELPKWLGDAQQIAADVRSLLDDIAKSGEPLSPDAVEEMRELKAALGRVSEMLGELRQRRRRQ